MRRATMTAGKRIGTLIAIFALLLTACQTAEVDPATAGGTTPVVGIDDAPSRATAEGQAQDQTLNVFAFFRPRSFDPALQGPATAGGNGLRRQYTEALLRPAANLEVPDVVAATAEGYEVSQDGLVYTFAIREAAKFNDGEPVRAQDFLYAWRRLIDPRVAAPLGGMFARVVAGGAQAAALGPDASDADIETALDGLGLAAVDDATFEVTLSRPAPYFKWIATLTAGAPVRQDVVEEFGADSWATDPATLITNGPFQVTEIGDSATTMEPNPHYWQPDRPRLDRLVAGYGLEPAPRWTQYLNDELDVSNGPPPASRAQALEDPRFADEIVRFPELSVQWLEFNGAAAPLDDPRVRLAIAQAIDRDAYNAIAADTGYPITSLIPKGMPGFDPDAGAAQAFDPDQAKATLADAGVDPAALDGMVLLTFAAQKTNALFIKDQLEKNLGVTIKVDSIGDSAVIDERVRTGDYDMHQTFIGHAANYPDPQDFFDVFLSTNPQNPVGWTNADYDRLVNKADAEGDTERRLELYGQAHRILVEDAPVAFLVQLQRVFWVKPWVRGIQRTPIDSAFLLGDLYTTEISIAER